MPETAPETIGDATFRTIRSDIIHGVLRPGDKLTLDRLKQRYEVSVGTLREVLTRLASESFVVAEGQKGFEVTPASEDELRELGSLRLLLESLALGLSLASGDLEWEGRVVAAHHKLAAIEKRLLAGEARNIVDWVRYDFSFHNALISACGSAALLSLHATIFDRFLRYHMLASSFRGAGVVGDHQALFELALARDASGAVDMLAGHVGKGVEHVLSTGVLKRAA